ncbi:terpene synthase family protein [Kitasatospora camelliae]|uniref:Terpene synthase family protein n=1 Tax=Kitasatospora camelliae TaxID=3156397 RepID=A0AAU8JSX7_9ACTN
MGFCEDPERRRRITGMAAHEFVCRIARDAEGTVGLELVSQWLCSMLTLDDEWDAGRLSRDPARMLTTVTRLLMVINSPEALRDDPDLYLASVRDVFQRARLWAPAEAVKRWADSQLESFMGAACVVAHRADARTMSLDDYLTVGPLDRGTRSCINIIEVAERTAVPQSELDTPRVRALTQAAKFLVLCAADVYSYRRESSQGALESNIVDVLQRHHGTSQRQALLDAAALHDRTMCLFLKLSERTEKHASHELRRHIRQLHNLVSGNLEWGSTSHRYTADPAETLAAPIGGAEGGAPAGSTGGPGSAGHARPPAVRAERPSDGRLSAPPMSAISWWWDQLR